MSIPPAALVAALTAFMGGGLAGSVFTYFANRREPTVVTYSVTQTPLADPSATSLIPNLTVNVGKDPIHELHAYSIEIDVPQGGRQEHAEVGVFFARKIRIYGKAAEAPSQLYSINCDSVDNGVTCQLSPLSRANDKPYRIVLATDEKQAPRVEVAVVGAEVLPASDYLARKSRFGSVVPVDKILERGALAFSVIFVILLQLKLLARVKKGAVVVGKIADAAGQPIADADVEVVLDSPYQIYPPTKTDRFGDFIFGGLRKMSLLEGRIRITHPLFDPVDMRFDSPILSLRLSRRRTRTNEESGHEPDVR